MLQHIQQNKEDFLHTPVDLNSTCPFDLVLNPLLEEIRLSGIKYDVLSGKMND